MSTFFGVSSPAVCKTAASRMFKAWCILDASTACVVGVDDGETVFLRVCTHEELTPFIGASRESKNPDNFRVRLRIGKKALPEWIAKSAKLGTVSELLEIKQNYGFSTKGEAFEIMVKKALSVPAVKDSTTWWNGSDMVLPDGRTFSIKYNEATICQESHFIEMGFTTEDFPK